jgi:hypothetical protein
MSQAASSAGKGRLIVGRNYPSCCGSSSCVGYFLLNRQMFTPKRFVPSSTCCQSQCTDVVGPAVPLSLLCRCCISHVIICYAPFQTVALALSPFALSVCRPMVLFGIYRGFCPAIQGHPIQSFLLCLLLLPCAVGASYTLSLSPLPPNFVLPPTGTLCLPLCSSNLRQTLYILDS